MPRHRNILTPLILSQMASKLFLGIIKVYRVFISPVLPARCRYYPTCSEYGQQAIRWHGAWRGGYLTLKRVCRCHPLGGHGIDLVPLPMVKWTYYYVDNQVISAIPKDRQDVGSNSIGSVQPHVSHETSNTHNQPNVSCETNQGRVLSVKNSIRYQTVYIDRISYRVMLNRFLNHS